MLSTSPLAQARAPSAPGTTTTAPGALPPALLRELRTDHAGETGAVMIYRGVLSVTRDPALRAFALHHLHTEQRHLAEMERVVPPAWRSRLLPLWRVSGWFTGALPACFGPPAVYATIQAVEAFVDRHYAAQIDLIDSLLAAPAGAAAEPAAPSARDAQRGSLATLQVLLSQCRQDEIAHHDEAASRRGGRAGPLLRAWQAMVGLGSDAAVRLCRRV